MRLTEHLPLGFTARHGSGELLTWPFDKETRAMSTRVLLLSVFAGAVLTALAGCPSQTEQPQSVVQEQILTPERAKEALLDMVRSKPAKELGWFQGDVPDQMAKVKIEEEEDGWYAWTAAFRFNTSKAIYSFVVRPRPPACVFQYKGSFVTKDGRWTATPPELVSSALQARK
jgi:hypothetical protein